MSVRKKIFNYFRGFFILKYNGKKLSTLRCGLFQARKNSTCLKRKLFLSTIHKNNIEARPWNMNGKPKSWMVLPNISTKENTEAVFLFLQQIKFYDESVQLCKTCRHTFEKRETLCWAIFNVCNNFTSGLPSLLTFSFNQHFLGLAIRLFVLFAPPHHIIIWFVA